MTCFRLHRRIVIKINGLILLVVTLACSLPFRSYITLSGEATSVTNESEMNAIPSKVLTDVAATLFAPQLATFTTQVIEPRETTSPTQPNTTPVTTTEATLSASDILSIPATYQPDVPPASFTAQTGKGVSITGLNLHNCDGFYTANFGVENTGAQPLESTSLQLMDLSTDQDFSDPSISNAPFTESDRICTPGGINKLEPGARLYVASPIGPDQLSGHTILANFLFCTQEDLNGECYPRSVEFILP